MSPSRSQSTSGASREYPGWLISWTALPYLQDVNTAPPFAGIVTFSYTAVEKPKSKHAKKAAEARRNFDMMPASASGRHKKPIAADSFRTMNTPLERKAQEEMSDFEREYPW
jgi:hypothetical protein